MTCLLCDIISGKACASIVYQNECVISFLSQEQPNPYTVVVAPRRHIETLYDLDDDLAAQLFQTTVLLGRVIREVSDCPGLSLIQANGGPAGQEIRHMHIHLMPRFPNDTVLGRLLLRWDRTPREQAELERLAVRLHKQLQLQEHVSD